MAKADFRNYVTALVAKSEASDAHDFWSTIFCCQLSFEDVCEVLSFEEVRKLRTKQPKSLAMLIIKSVEQAHLFTKYLLAFFILCDNFVSTQFLRRTDIVRIPTSCVSHVVQTNFFQVHWHILHSDDERPPNSDESDARCTGGCHFYRESFLEQQDQGQGRQGSCL